MISLLRVVCNVCKNSDGDISCCMFCFQAEDGIRDLVRSRGLGDVYKRQIQRLPIRHRGAQIFYED